MRKTRLYIPHPLIQGEEIALSAQASHHINTVLRKKVGDILYVFNGEEAFEYLARIIFIKKSTVRIQLNEKYAVNNESPLQLALYQGISRGDHMDISIQKAVELGVQNIIPIICERSQIKLNANVLDKKMQHWQNIITHATQQSWRCYLPNLHNPISFDEALNLIGDEYTLLFDTISAQPINTNEMAQAEKIGCWIGPEGGFTPEEVHSAKQASAHIVNLGGRVLRTETATISALSIVQFVSGDFSSS